MSVSLASELRAELLAALRERAATIATRWQEAIALTGVPELSDVEVRTELQKQLDVLIPLLGAETDTYRQARGIGATLVQLRYKAPESLAATMEVLTDELTGGLNTTTMPVVMSSVGKLMGMIAAGFSAEMRSAILSEQEQIRRALIAARQQQEEVIQAQAAALNELSTPLIPVSDTVVVMPLVGAVDSRRANQVMENLLNGITERNAEIAILDITGVAVVDTQVANGLIRAAQAVNLVGARIVLTGIRPEVAQTLVGLGVDLSRIVTRSTLQDGISYAMGQ